MMPELAADIWLEIAHILPRDALATVSLANRRLRELLKALLFAHFDFHPYELQERLLVGSDFPRLPRLPDPVGLQNTVERLEFWSSEAIAPLVRTCAVSPWHEPMEGWTFSASPTPFMLLETFFQHLERFKRLRGLTLRRANFHYSILVDSCAALKLDYLEVEHCGVVPPADIVTGNRIRISRFFFADRAFDERSLAVWLTGFDRDALQDLELHCHFPLRTRGELVVGPFANVGVMSLTMDFGFHEDLRLLAYFPALTSLSIRHWRNNSEDFILPPPGSVHFPQLKILNTTWDLLPLLLSADFTPALEKLGVYACTPSSLISGLRTTLSPHSTQTISSLVLMLDHEGESDWESMQERCDSARNGLEKILGFFPLLKELRVTYLFNSFLEVDDEENVQSISAKYFAALPTIGSLGQTLTTLFITWAFEDDSLAEYASSYRRHGASEDQLVATKNALLERCPELKNVWLDGNLFIYRWQAGIGERDGSFVDDKDDVDLMRAELAPVS
ncbi:hypothetical protein C8F01DRAFT_1155611 [Mycena amicta]|nr:hypothetical protein C8F01DRAFT_1155611 [Mycena amicta]